MPQRAQAQEVAVEVERQGGKAFLVQADLSTEAGCDELIQYMHENHSHLDVLVNNAGGLPVRHKLAETTWDILNQAFCLNTFSVMYLTGKLIPLLQKGRQANIINLSSLAIRTGSPTASAYSAAKGAVDVYTKSLAKELAPHIRANPIAPGFIDTPFHDKVTSAEMFKAVVEGTALKKLGKSLDIAKTVDFIIRNDFLTGETIDVNGGFYMR